ncbi:Rpn family recombination-promoting nuclease/putative transposase [Roseofilum casamattae]|uniref:Rpn family recombination-promoting nuclease/putative transposase n=1 Tax=Roseofilum casamattae BLCC-M143 TaxID=3022442 RepID=A0ABT7C062_9CYAN|nr:Rpn family recombination-promoting nuclease/putative transposase [Roseofilum casamattae]MDJ1184840.1 Rpn family recombination-promoting nuclease/putative transposase [Roseofilum casamattae BLCC-M143]
MAFDNTCKFLATQNPTSFVRWLLPQVNPNNVQVLKTELSSEPVRADSLILLKAADTILHLEFERLPNPDRPIPERMVDYWLRLYRKYHCSITQVVIFLKQTNSPQVYVDRFQVDNTIHRYRVLRLWEQDPKPFLKDPALLPLAPLTRSNAPRDLLEQVAGVARQITNPNQRQEIIACTAIMSGLIHNPQTIQDLFHEDILEDSSFYQFILQKGIKEGIQQGIQQARQEARQEAVLMMLHQKIGMVSTATEEKIYQLSLTQLGVLMEAIPHFQQQQDLTEWLASVPQ